MDAKSPVKISKFTHSREDIVLNDSTKVKLLDSQMVSFPHNSNLVKNAVVILQEMNTLASGQLVNTQVEVAEVMEVVTHQTKGGPIDKQECLVRDTNQCRKLFLYGNDVNSLSVGKTYHTF